MSTSKTPLTDGEINERIAVACGVPMGTRNCCGGSYDLAIPDYATSLDAMSEAEKTLGLHDPENPKSMLYYVELSKAMNHNQLAFSASASVRATALLLTLEHMPANGGKEGAS